MRIRPYGARAAFLAVVLLMLAGCVAPVQPGPVVAVGDEPATTQGPAAPSETAVTEIAAAEEGCTPTNPDMLGPFYVPGAPERNSVGEGYSLSGRVLDADSCTPIAGATLEFWMAGPDGEYKDAYRATWRSAEDGAYTFTSHVPVPYAGRPPHIHVRATADGYVELVTQHYPAAGATDASMDIVLTK